MAGHGFYRQIAALHATSINQGFLATLGVPFLSLMYRAIDEAEDSVLLVEMRDDRVLGFVSAGKGMGPIYRRMLRRPFALAWSLLPSLARPSRVKRILDILRYGQGKSAESVLPSAELLSIAVAQGSRGTGIAEMLYRRLVAHFGERGVDVFKIIVGDALAPAHRFYLRMGAEPVGRIEVHAGEGSKVYVQSVVPGKGVGT